MGESSKKSRDVGVYRNVPHFVRFVFLHSPTVNKNVLLGAY